MCEGCDVGVPLGLALCWTDCVKVEATVKPEAEVDALVSEGDADVAEDARSESCVLNAPLEIDCASSEETCA